MPSRWWVPVPGIDPSRVRLDQLHAAVSGWLDETEEDHAQLIKPYALSPLSEPVSRPGAVGFEVSALTEAARNRFLTQAGFRQGRRWSPWPAPASVLRGPSETWNRWSGCEPRVPTHQDADNVRVPAEERG